MVDRRHIAYYNSVIVDDNSYYNIVMMYAELKIQRAIVGTTYINAIKSK
jgi:hypothetical protein